MKLGGINTTKIHVAKDSQRIKKKKKEHTHPSNVNFRKYKTEVERTE